MPTFELALLVKKLPRQEVASVLKRTAHAIFDHGGIIRKMENLGLKPTPYRISSHNVTHNEAHYFIIHYDCGSYTRQPLFENFMLDVDIIRTRIYKTHDMTRVMEEDIPCTLHEDLLPPPYRPAVQEMIAFAESKKKPEYKYNSGLDYYPFQR